MTGTQDDTHGPKLKEQLVNLDDLGKGLGATSGRYTCSRELEQDYAIEDKILGSGMSGPVLLAKGRADGRQYAVKSFKKNALSAEDRAALRNEAELYLTLDHPHIAQLLRVFETDEMLHLVMELLEGGEVYDRLAAARRYTEEVAADTVYQMLLAVAYLHAHNIAHRDLKLENYLYAREDSDHLKLIDFGFAAKFSNSRTAMSQACGSLHYAAPEVLNHCYTVQADLWSLGVISYMLLIGTPVFLGSDSEVLRKIKCGKPRFSARFSCLSEASQDFVRRLLVRDPDQRLTAAEALEHPWIAGRHAAESVQMDSGILDSMRAYARASHFRKTVLCMTAWTLSVEEQEDLRQQFLHIDSQKQGTITLQEFRAVLKKSFHVDSAEAARLFAGLDSDSSHEIEYTEFLAAALVGRLRAHGDILHRAFERFDADGDGQISAEDLHAVLRDDFEEDEVEELLAEVERSASGRIDFEAFLAYFQRPEAGEEAGEPEAPPARALKRRHTEKLGALIDRLMRRDGGGAGSPTARDWPLWDVARRAPVRRAKTAA